MNNVYRQVLLDSRGPSCPLCKGQRIKLWYAGGHWKAQCLTCYWHGLESSLKSEEVNSDRRI